MNSIVISSHGIGVMLLVMLSLSAAVVVVPMVASAQIAADNNSRLYESTEDGYRLDSTRLGH